MSPQKIWLAFHEDGESGEYVGAAATPEGAKGRCIAHQQIHADTIDKMNAWRKANGLELHAQAGVINLVWDDLEDESSRTNDASTYAEAWDEGYRIVTDILFD